MFNDILVDNYQPEYKSNYNSSDDKMVAFIENLSYEIEHLNTALVIGNNQFSLLIESGRVCIILNRSLKKKQL